MSEEKDDFLREIDELLQGDLDLESEEPAPKKSDPTLVVNVTNGVDSLDLNSLDSGSNENPLEEQASNHVVTEQRQGKVTPPPKTG